MSDEIIRMAREADIDWHKHWDDDESNRLERFAALVAAAEREACAKVCDEGAAEYMKIARLDNNGRYDWKAYGCEEVAAAIRARGE